MSPPQSVTAVSLMSAFSEMRYNPPSEPGTTPHQRAAIAFADALAELQTRYTFDSDAIAVQLVAAAVAFAKRENY